MYIFIFFIKNIKNIINILLINFRLKRNSCIFKFNNLNLFLFLISVKFLKKMEILKNNKIKVFLKYYIDKPIFNKVYYFSYNNKNLIKLNKNDFFIKKFFKLNLFIVIYYKKYFYSLMYFIINKLKFGYYFCKFYN